MKNFHLPLPDQVYNELKVEAQRSRVPATAMARNAIQAWLLARKKAVRRNAIAAYAAANAGTELDLDGTLEGATIEFLLKADAP